MAECSKETSFDDREEGEDQIDSNNDILFDILEQKGLQQYRHLLGSGDEQQLTAMADEEDEGMWDSMAVMAAEQWNKGEVDEMAVKDLLPNGHANLSPTERCEVFLSAAQYGMLGLVQELHTSYGDELLSYQDEDQYTALHRASYNGHLSIAEYLIEKKANVNARTEDGWQPIHCACRWNKTDVASLLLQNGAIVNSQTNGGQTPLHLAASNDQAKATLELLLTTEGVDVSLCNNAGETAENLASSYGRLGYLFEIKEDCIDYTGP